MSAYMVEREHIRYLANAALKLESYQHSLFSWHWNLSVEGYERRGLAAGDWQKAIVAGQMLWDANLASVRARYPGAGELPGPSGESFEYKDHSPDWATTDPVQALKACHCFEYQACEHEGWEASEAKAFIGALEKAAIRHLPGYENAEWGAPKPAQALTE